MRAFRSRPAASAYPRDLALEQDALITARKCIDGDGAIRRIAPEVSGPADQRRTGTEQGDGRRARDASEMRYAGVRTEKYRRALDEGPELR